MVYGIRDRRILGSGIRDQDLTWYMESGIGIFSDQGSGSDMVYGIRDQHIFGIRDQDLTWYMESGISLFCDQGSGFNMVYGIRDRRILESGIRDQDLT